MKPPLVSIVPFVTSLRKVVVLLQVPRDWHVTKARLIEADIIFLSSFSLKGLLPQKYEAFSYEVTCFCYLINRFNASSFLYFDKITGR